MDLHNDMILLWSLSLDAWITIATVITIITVMLLTKVRTDAVMLIAISVLFITGVLDAKEMCSDSVLTVVLGEELATANAPALMEGDIRVNAAGEYHSNGNLRAYTVDFAGNQQGWLWDWRWSDKASDSYKNPRNGTVDNSQFREQALNGMFGLSRNWGVSRLKLSYYHFRPGIIEIGEEEEEEDDEEAAEEHPFQRINHYKAVLDNSILLGEGQLKAIIGYQHNRRKEFETPDECGLDFLLQTVNYDLRYVSPEWSGWKTNLGVGGMWQESQNKGTEYLIPAYRFFDFGVFATASKSFIDRLHLSGGLRFDTRHLNSHQLEDRFEAFSRNFSGLTGSVGAIYNLQKNLDLRLNVARGYRAPNLSELGSNGRSIFCTTLAFLQPHQQLYLRREGWA